MYEPFSLSPELKRLLLAVARESVTAELETRPPDLPEPSAQIAEEARARRGMFVTIRVRHDSTFRLRGCIGRTDSEVDLYRRAVDLGKAAAFSDPRFPPLEKKELPDVYFEISVLSPLSRLENSRALQSVTIGRDGLVVRRGTNAGLLLPQVATEYGWDAGTFLDQTCRKAGLPSGSWRRSDAQIFRFEALVFGEFDQAL